MFLLDHHQKLNLPEYINDEKEEDEHEGATDQCDPFGCLLKPQ